MLDGWEIFPERIKLDREISDGAFGKVYTAAILPTALMNNKHDTVVVKLLKGLIFLIMHI